MVTRMVQGDIIIDWGLTCLAVPVTTPTGLRLRLKTNLIFANLKSGYVFAFEESVLPHLSEAPNMTVKPSARFLKEVPWARNYT